LPQTVRGDKEQLPTLSPWSLFHKARLTLRRLGQPARQRVGAATGHAGRFAQIPQTLGRRFQLPDGLRQRAGRMRRPRERRRLPTHS